MNRSIASIILENSDTHVYRYYDGGEWKTSMSGKTVSVYSPIDTSVLGNVQSVTHEEIDEVISRAHAAQGQWEETPLHKRIQYMKNVAQWMRQYEAEFVDLLIREIGKSKKESASEISRTADLIEYYAGEAHSLLGERLESDNFPGFEKGKISLVERAAHGVILAIAPFNYPINLAVSKIVPALLMGNAVVFKPPTQGSISGLYLTELFVRSGIPSSVMSCITGAGRDIGDYLVSHTGINMIAFTGSTKTGNTIAEKTKMTPLLFECGGNNPVIVLPDADVEATAKELVKGAFSYSGQRCTGIKYVLAQEPSIDELLPLVMKQMEEQVSMGNPNDETTKLVGPLINEQAAIEIENGIRQALAEGAEIVMGGKRNGWYMEPTILKNVRPDMEVIKTEMFGPLLSFVTVSSFEEAIEIINHSIYGLQASIFTQDEGKGLSMGKKLHVGTVQVNGSPQRGPDHFPFMGIKGSGIGVQGVKYSLEAMSRLRSTVLNNPQ